MGCVKTFPHVRVCVSARWKNKEGDRENQQSVIVILASEGNVLCFCQKMRERGHWRE